MNSTRGRPSNRAKAARSMSARELESSNLTTVAFLGGKQKEWMSGGTLPITSKKSAGLIPSVPASPLYATNTSSDYQSPIQNTTSIKGNDFSVVPFPPDFDRGRFPSQRRRRGGTKAYPGRPSDNLTSHFGPSITMPPIAESYNSVTSSKEPTGNASNLLPSPSPSVETHRPSCNIVDLEKVMTEPTPEENELQTRLEELVAQHGGIDALEKKLQEAENTTGTVSTKHSSTSPVLVADAERLKSTNLAASAEHTNQAEDRSTPLSTAQAGNRATSVSHKRPSENAHQSRKRFQKPAESLLEGLEPAQGPSRGLDYDSGQRSSNSNPVLGLEMQTFSEKVSHRLAFSNLKSRPGNAIERPRLDLLRDACQRMDCFYLCLHQLYCLEHMRRCLGDAIQTLNDAHRGGLAKLSYLLVRNDDLSADAIKWFSDFPLPLDVLLSGRPAFRLAYDKVLNCLSRLAINWQPFRAECDTRGYPPLVDELIVIFGAESFTLQQVIFRALLRDIWKGLQDHCFQQVDDMFPRSYKEVMFRKSANASIDEVRAQNQAFVHAYQQLSLLHQRHTQQDTTRSILPSQQDHPGARPMSEAEFIHEQTTPRHRSSNTRSSIVLDSQTVPQTAFSGRSTERTASSIPAQQGTPIPRYEVRSSQGQSPQQNIADSTFSIARRRTYPQPPILPSTHHHHAAHQNSVVPEQSQPRRTSQSMTTNSHLTSSLPLELVGNQAQSSPQVAQIHHHALPSNASSQSPVTLLQSNTIQSQQPLPAQTSPTYPDTYPPSQPRPPYTAYSDKPERVHHHQTPTSTHTQFIRADPTLNPSHANPTLNALHQAHIRSPTLSSLAPHEKNISVPKIFRYVRHVIMPPRELSKERRHVSWDFTADKAMADSMVKDTPGSYGSPPTRALTAGSRLCRVRCIKINKPTGLPSQSEWVVAENVWPGSTAVLLNGEALEIRKKSHHGKNLPIDATPHVKEGKNTMSTSIIGLLEDCTSKYAIGVEIIEVIEKELIKNNIKIKPYHEARKQIIDQSRNKDPEVQILNSQLILDCTDPFMARIFDVPVRGTSCRHNQCFDRDVFLQTRSSKNTNEPCGPDEFRCPICGLDARPQSLMIDGFFVQIREELQRKGRLDAKAVILHPLGDWEIKEEEEATGEQGDGSGVRSIHPRESVGRQSTPRDVIQLDDD